MPAPKRAYRAFNRASGYDIGKRATVVYVCRGCGLWVERPNAGTIKGPPSQCIKCGRLDYDRFDSKSEAMRWAVLRRNLAVGQIADLRRQVRYPLLTVDERTGKPVKFGEYIADFVYHDLHTDEVVIEDSKGSAISPEAELKLRIMEHSGRTVTLTKG